MHLISFFIQYAVRLARDQAVNQLAGMPATREDARIKSMWRRSTKPAVEFNFVVK
jgi:hypothetical protein